MSWEEDCVPGAPSYSPWNSPRSSPGRGSKIAAQRKALDPMVSYAGATVPHDAVMRLMSVSSSGKFASDEFEERPRGRAIDPTISASGKYASVSMDVHNNRHPDRSIAPSISNSGKFASMDLYDRPTDRAVLPTGGFPLPIYHRPLSPNLIYDILMFLQHSLRSISRQRHPSTRRQRCRQLPVVSRLILYRFLFEILRSITQ